MIVGGKGTVDAGPEHVGGNNQEVKAIKFVSNEDMGSGSDKELQINKDENLLVTDLKRRKKGYHV